MVGMPPPSAYPVSSFDPTSMPVPFSYAMFPDVMTYPVVAVDGVWHRIPYPVNVVAPPVCEQSYETYRSASPLPSFDEHGSPLPFSFSPIQSPFRVPSESPPSPCKAAEKQLLPFSFEPPFITLSGEFDEEPLDPLVRRVSVNQIGINDYAYFLNPEKVITNLDDFTVVSPKALNRQVSPPERPVSAPRNPSPAVATVSSPPVPIPLIEIPSETRLRPQNSRLQHYAEKLSANRRSPGISPVPSRSDTRHRISNRSQPRVLVPKPRIPQHAPLRMLRSNNPRGIVGVCGKLKVNPYFSDCHGHITAVKGEDEHDYFICSNCDTRRRFTSDPDGSNIQLK